MKKERERDMAKKRKLVKRDIEAPGNGREHLEGGVGQLPALQIVTLIQNNIQTKRKGYPEGRKEDINKQKKKGLKKKKVSNCMEESLWIWKDRYKINRKQ